MKNKINAYFKILILSMNIFFYFLFIFALNNDIFSFCIIYGTILFLFIPGLLIISFIQEYQNRPLFNQIIFSIIFSILFAIVISLIYGFLGILSKDIILITYMIVLVLLSFMIQNSYLHSLIIKIKNSNEIKKIILLIPIVIIFILVLSMNKVNENYVAFYLENQVCSFEEDFNTIVKNNTEDTIYVNIQVFIEDELVFSTQTITVIGYEEKKINFILDNLKMSDNNQIKMILSEEQTQDIYREIIIYRSEKCNL